MPHSSRYGASVVHLIAHLCSVSVTTVIYGIFGYFEPRYNGAWLLTKLISNSNECRQKQDVSVQMAKLRKFEVMFWFNVHLGSYTFTGWFLSCSLYHILCLFFQRHGYIYSIDLDMWLCFACNSIPCVWCLSNVSPADIESVSLFATFRIKESELPARIWRVFILYT